MENLEQILEQIIRGNRQLADDLCRTLSRNEKSTVVSSIGIHSLLTLLSQDPWFFDKEKFNRSLHVTDITETSEQYKYLLTLLKNVDNRKFSLASKTFFKDQCVLQDPFRTRLTNGFLYESNSLDFNEKDAVVRSINDWVGDKTANRSKKIADPGLFNDKLRLALLNTTYFKDNWSKPFTETASDTFHVSGTETVQVEMLKIKSEFYYKEDGFTGCKVLQLPFSDDISLLVLLPDKEKGESLESCLNCNIEYAMENMSLEEVDVLLPKFKIEGVTELDDYIKQMGLESALSANYTGVINGEELNLDKIQQKVYIDVNKDGLEAASGLMCSLNEAEDVKILPRNGLVVYEMNIKTDVSNRFAKSNVVWKVKNVEESSKEASFKVVLSETAFITGFIMEIEGKSYKSYIKEKEEAKAIYDKAVAGGKSAGLVAAQTRDSKEFSVSVNLEPGSVAVFNLTYEEMLQRVHDQYELVLNICPGQIIDDLNIEVDIMETQPLKFVKTPPLRSGKEMVGAEYHKFLEPSPKIQMVNAKTATIKFRPDPKKQVLMAHYLGGEPSSGLSGQFVVQYDVERDARCGQVLLQDGYFVHFFAPNDLDPLPKHVVFVLDTSGSMGGRKIEQLKDAMLSILKEIRSNDIINIIEFSGEVNFWDIEAEKCMVLPVFNDVEDFQDPFIKLGNMNLPVPTLATEETLIKARNVVEKMEAFGGTYMIGGLDTALFLIKIAQDKVEQKSDKHQPIIVFLTDGEPNVGLRSTEQIVDTVTKLNARYNKVPIFSLSFGRDADKNFLRRLSLKNQGFSRHIYEAADASLQLQDFYKQISSPLLADIQFKYDSEVAEVTRTLFPIYFRGSEIVVTGKYKKRTFPTTVSCCGPRGPIVIASVIETPVTSLERLWAYMTVKQLLDERETAEDGTQLTKKATVLALRYSFVTDVTSLVVVKPDAVSAVDSKDGDYGDGLLEDMGDRVLMCAQTVSASSGGFISMQHLYGAPRLSGGSTTGYRSQKHSRMKMAKMRGGGFAPRRMLMASVSDDRLEVDSVENFESEETRKLKKETKKFVADHPFVIILQFKKENKIVVLFKGVVYKPTY